ncbi:hypothetical protein B0H16DRAFT_1773151 [Mycena metata]|uniref:Uncharacterized protein n=1 Tax=Mycena metata TaxID=1033252 RepID=A0AAD7HYS3_9AGAR|nr:hypothetical protein B0H16DRAFT_1773151 [Mycena metata]
MALLPQELLNSIVREIDDVSTLKASCLAGSVFRDEAQRVLFSKFTMNPRARKPDAVYDLLQNSPHIASYITRLDIEFESSGEILAGDTESLLKIFDRLKNVQSCTAFSIPNGHIHAALLSAFLAFLSRQPLRELKVDSTLSLIPAVCLRLMTMAPAISFAYSFIADDNDFPTPDSQPAVPRMRELTLGTFTADVNALLARTQPQEYTQGLLRISLSCHDDPANGIVFANALTLEHIEFELGAGPPAIPLLPALRSVQLSSWREHQNPWFFDLVSTILGSSPLLVDLTLEFPFKHARPHIRPELLHRLDTALVEHTAAPSIRWRVLSYLDDEEKPAFADFVAYMRRGMPRVDGKHRLMLEAVKP